MGKRGKPLRPRGRLRGRQAKRQSSWLASKKRPRDADRSAFGGRQRKRLRWLPLGYIEGATYWLRLARCFGVQGLAPVPPGMREGPALCIAKYSGYAFTRKIDFIFSAILHTKTKTYKEEDTMGQYGIHRVEKVKGGSGIGGLQQEEEREKEYPGSDIDHTRTKDNIVLLDTTGGARWQHYVAEQIAAVGCRVRRDSVKAITSIYTASPEYMASLSMLSCIWTRRPLTCT